MVFCLQNNFALVYQILNPELIHMHLYLYEMVINCYQVGLLNLKYCARILMLFYGLSHQAFSLLRLMIQGHLRIITCLLVWLFLRKNRWRLELIGLQLSNEDSCQSLKDGLTLFLELEIHRNC